jgi:5-formyltetrahydrofolate cyclo-ligase
LLTNKEKNIIVPYVEKDNPILQLSELKDFNDLEPRTLGILEPKDDCIRKFDIQNVDLVIVPGLVFDKNGHRIGYGHGYYDRFLQKLKKNIKKIGFAFELQLIDKIPEEKYDVPVDIIVAEKRILKIQ